MGRYRRFRSKGYSRSNWGHARDHISHAKRLTKELGGTDQKVKDWFFNLNDHQLNLILEAYGREYGANAESYARKIVPQWSARIVTMSGMVSERLFKLLPRFMPLDVKYSIIEDLWKHYGPSSQRTIYVGPNVDMPTLSRVVQQHFDAKVTAYTIPTFLEERFLWLAANDSSVKQELLNYLRGLDKALAVQAVRIHVPSLMQHLKSDQPVQIRQMSQDVEVGKHTLTIVLSPFADGIQDNAPTPPAAPWPWWVWAIGAAIAVFLFTRLR